MKKNKLIIMAVVIIVVLGSISVAVLAVYKPDYIKNIFNKPYSAVYLTSGEMYIGKLSTFPKLVLTDAYLLQIVADPNDDTKKTFQLASLKDSLWSPDKIYLQRGQVIFTASIRDDSKVAQALKGK